MKARRRDIYRKMGSTGAVRASFKPRTCRHSSGL